MDVIYNLYQDTMEVNLQHAGSFSSLENAQSAAGVGVKEWIKEDDSTWHSRTLIIKKMPVNEFILA